jgi:hypothetical protein
VNVANRTFTYNWGGVTSTESYDSLGGYGDLYPNGKGAGMADLEANPAGVKFWDAYAAAIAANSAFTFDICKYVTEKWDEKKNPNTKLDKQPARQ